MKFLGYKIIKVGPLDITIQITQQDVVMGASASKGCGKKLYRKIVNNEIFYIKSWSYPECMSSTFYVMGTSKKNLLTMPKSKFPIFRIMVNEYNLIKTAKGRA